MDAIRSSCTTRPQVTRTSWSLAPHSHSVILNSHLAFGAALPWHSQPQKAHPLCCPVCKSLHLSMCQFLIWKNGDISTSIMGLCED